MGYGADAKASAFKGAPQQRLFSAGILFTILDNCSYWSLSTTRKYYVELGVKYRFELLNELVRVIRPIAAAVKFNWVLNGGSTPILVRSPFQWTIAPSEIQLFPRNSFGSGGREQRRFNSR